MRCVDGALVLGGPPCSLQVWMPLRRIFVDELQDHLRWGLLMASYTRLTIEAALCDAGRSSSLHLRSHQNPYGNTENQKVRLSNLIAENTAACQMLMTLVDTYSRG